MTIEVIPSLLFCLGVFFSCGRTLYLLINRYRNEIVVGELLMAVLCLFFEWALI